ncbi:hypothetical protein Tco_1223462 [Tanacetum coccineum]
MAISSSSSSSSSDSEVQKCSKQCLESFKCLQKNYDTEREKHNKAKLEIRGYEISLELLESRIIGHEKMKKAVKERDELKDKIAKWEESTKNLEEILKSQMSARDKTGLGYSTQLNELSSNHETDSENSLSIFDGRSSDDKHIPENDKFSKNGYKTVPPPITRNFLTPRADISFAGLDKYAIRNKIIESQTNDTNTVKPKLASESVVSSPKINKDSVIIEDWTSDDEEKCLKCKKLDLRIKQSTEHLIKDCNFHDKKSQESNLKNVVNTGKREIKPVWDNTKRVNLSIFSKYPHLSETFVLTGVSTRTGLHRPSINTAMSVCTARPSINIARPVSTARLSINTTRPGNPEILLQDHAVVDSGCSSHMTGNKAYLSRTYEDFKGGFVSIGSDPKEGKSPSISFMRPFGCPMTILNTLDSLGKFDGKSDEGSSGKDKGPTQEYILLLLQPHRTRFLVKDVVQDAQA